MAQLMDVNGQKHLLIKTLRCGSILQEQLLYLLTVYLLTLNKYINSFAVFLNLFDN